MPFLSRHGRALGVLALLVTLSAPALSQDTGPAATPAKAGEPAGATPAKAGEPADEGKGPLSAKDIAALAAAGEAGPYDRADGLFTVVTAKEQGLVMAKLPAPDTETGVIGDYIHLSYLRTGLGSNPVGLDRGLGGANNLVRLSVVGDAVFVTARNTRFVARSSVAAERRATEESFARSTLAALPILARGADGAPVVDLGAFLTGDVMGIAARLKSRGQGSFSLDASRSAPLPREALAFPDNVEFEASLTFQSNDPGSEVQQTAPEPGAVTFTMHHSFVRLPDDGYTPRLADPRVGSISLPVTDYAAGLDEPLMRRVVVRHRLRKTDPAAARSTVEEPIVFYVDPGAPKRVRDALIEGANWWKEAFEAAGFIDGYRVEVLPEGAHPLDARYNVIQWVHRQTRGWSYGRPIYDPRTGEIIKAVITLGSLRVRHDRMIFEGLLDAQRSGSGGTDDPIEIALARLRQLSAHEVGHGLGFIHNMAASADGRASVMDYPAPLVSLTDGALDFSKAYGVGVGPWDIVSARYAYAQVPAGKDEAAFLETIAEEARRDRLFVADAHSRPVSGAHPQGSVWDNGADAIAELDSVIGVRDAALGDFSLDNLPAGAPVADLRQVLVPIYLYHRYQVAAAAKALGGASFGYEVAPAKGAEAAMVPVPGPRQIQALMVLLRTIEPSFLALPERVVGLLQPTAINWFDGRFTRDELRSDAYPAFDETQAAAVAADVTLGAILNEARLMRVMQFHASDPALPSVDGVFNRVSRTVFADVPDSARLALVQETVAHRYVAHLMDLAMTAPPLLAVRAERHLASIRDAIESRVTDRTDPRRIFAVEIKRFLERPAQADRGPSEAPRTPPGSPIGAGEAFGAGEALGACQSCWFCEDAF